MSLDRTTLDQFDTDGLVKALADLTGNSVPKHDIKAMKKSNITGYNLARSATQETFERLGLSWGTSSNLASMKDTYLGLKRKASETNLAEYDLDKRLQKDYESQSKGASSRAHIQEGSGDTTETQRSNKRRAERLVQQVKAAQEHAPQIRHLVEPNLERRRLVIEFFSRNFKDQEAAKDMLSSPSSFVKLPFPFLGIEPKRFRFPADQKHYDYMGREAFGSLVKAFDSMTGGIGLPNLWVYGLMGYGKSHLLATLTCFLTAYKYRVVYLPDCRVCHEDPVRYLQQSLLFAWCDLPDKVEEIIRLQDKDDVVNFIANNWSTSVVFIIDQLNALDDDDDTSTKTQTLRWLARCRSGLKSILSTSANNLSFHRMTQRQNYDRLFTVYGGFTKSEMDAWWKHHSTVSLGDHTRDEVEDYTGCNPLLLTSCVEEGRVNFSCGEIRAVIKHAKRFAERMKTKCSEWEWLTYLEYVRACITERAVPSVEPEHIDHRFFHEKDDETGYCLCGAVRDAIIKKLASLGTYLFSIEDSLRAMAYLSSNASVIGYFLEHAILRSIVTAGVPCLDIIGPMPQIVFQDFPSYNLTHEKALYVPEAYNFPAIDAVLLYLNHREKTAQLFPIQVTIQKTHRSSEEQFFNNWSFWSGSLGEYGEYKITVTFIWVTSDQEFKRRSQGEKLRKLRDGSEKVVHPNYDSIFIPLNEVSSRVWKRYVEIKELQQELLLAN